MLTGLCAGRDQQHLQEDLLSLGLLLGRDLQGDGDFRRKQPSGLIRAQMSEQGQGLAGSQPLMSANTLLALLCQLITALSGTLMHVPLTAIQLSSLLCTSYQYMRR